MTWIIVISVIGGITSGAFLVPDSLISKIDVFVTGALAFLLFCIGMDIGKNRAILKSLHKDGLKIVFLPISIAIGSIFGAVLLGLFMGIPVNETSAVGAGFGWYSLSGIMITQIYNTETGTLAFLTNVWREILACIIIPITAKYFGKYAAIAPGGATTMDVTLPVIQKSVGTDMVMAAFINGAILSAMVPILVPLLIKIPF